MNENQLLYAILGEIRNLPPAVSIPVNTVAPVLSAAQGVVSVSITSGVGTWTNTPTSYTYQWALDGIDITGETTYAYAPIQADATGTLTCKVTAHNAAGASSPASSAGVLVYDADAWAYLTAASISDATQRTARNNLTVGMKNASLYTKIRRDFGILGSTASPQSYDAIDPSRQITWHNSPTHSASGVLFDGATNYGDLGFSPNDLGATGGISIYINVMCSGVNQVPIGTQNGPTNEQYWILTNPGINYYAGYGQTEYAVKSAAPTTGMFSINRGSATDLRLDKNGVSVATNTNSVTPGSVSLNFFIGGNNWDNSIFSNAWDGQLASVIAHDYLTEAESLTLYGLVQAYQTALSRQA